MRNFIYVCDNNKGRSPALEIYTRGFLHDLGVKGIRVSSAGVWKDSIAKLIREGHNRPSHTVSEILLQQGYDIRDHTLTHLGEIVNPYIVLAVNSDVYNSALEHFPALKDKIMLAGEYIRSHKHREIYGPGHESRKNISSERERYVRMLYELEGLAKRVSIRIRREFSQ